MLFTDLSINHAVFNSFENGSIQVVKFIKPFTLDVEKDQSFDVVFDEYIVRYQKLKFDDSKHTS